MSKLLLIEDDSNTCDMVRDRLEADKHIVEVAQNGNDGLALLRCCQYDDVIIDWQLPELSGVDVLKQYRDAGGKTPVVMLTGKTEISNKEEGFDAGADDYLTKPFDGRELSARVKALLRRTSDTRKTLITYGESSVAHRYVKPFGLSLRNITNELTVFNGAACAFHLPLK